MRKDIELPKVEDIAVAVVQEENNLKQAIWNVYLINLKKEAIEGVLVSSKGYGEKDGERVASSTLRHFLDVVPAQSFKKIEPLDEKLFGISNEFWVSFYLNKTMYDKKYIFLAETIQEANFINVPIINKSGVMIK